MLVQIYVYVSIVPIAAPVITKAVRTSITTAEIQWKPMSINEAGGFITGYNALILESSDEKCITTINFKEISTTATDSTISLDELKPFKAYCISLACRTKKGIGKYSNTTLIVCKNLYSWFMVYCYISVRTPVISRLYDKQ